MFISEVGIVACCIGFVVTGGIYIDALRRGMNLVTAFVNGVASGACLAGIILVSINLLKGG